MALLTLSDAQLAFGHFLMLDQADFSLEPGERVGLIGRNGTGKSSLLRVLAGKIPLDDGLLTRQKEVRITYVEQEPQFTPGITVYEAVASGLDDLRALLAQYEALTLQLGGQQDDSILEKMHAVQNQLDTADAWNLNSRIESALMHLELNGNDLVENLSGGMHKRVALAQGLVTQPDVLLLDEPTNHLDFESIIWLEALMRDYPGTILFITHDRHFLDHIATRIVELDRGKLLSYPGNFTAYKNLKAEQLAIEAVENAKFDKFLAQEEVWIRKGVEARRTRNEGRVRRLESLRNTRSARREQQGRVRMDVTTGEQSGKRVVMLEHISKAYGDKIIVRDFSTQILRGDKIGIMGPNGIGKTTLLRLILGEESADSGKVDQGTRLQIAYFDQLRTQLNEDATLVDTISPGSEWVEIGETRKHVMTYLSDFLFSPERARSPVKSLSGGERNRLLLAQLFARPANVLVLDEPTNDLDIDTLELLEELLQDYEGTVFLVSHDRAFLDNVVTQVIVAEGDGIWQEYVGGYSDWERTRDRMQEIAVSSKNFSQPAAQQMPKQEETATPVTGRRKKLSYKDQRELDALPEKIQALEQEQHTISERLNDPALYQNNADESVRLHQRFAEIDEALLACLTRWEALEAMTKET